VACAVNWQNFSVPAKISAKARLTNKRLEIWKNE